ncbi:MAG TPA: DAK2 domain-containing protein, partial [Chloroflexota bacterium]|nr:DAK2 domain-containing protein [Chloroflexota bacterium]
MTSPTVCDGTALRKALVDSTALLRARSEAINALNVFPVPDGDTGTNMTLTMQEAVRRTHDVADSAVGAVASAAAHGALLGARGNSGVILSQYLRG